MVIFYDLIILVLYFKRNGRLYIYYKLEYSYIYFFDHSESTCVEVELNYNLKSSSETSMSYKSSLSLKNGRGSPIIAAPQIAKNKPVMAVNDGIWLNMTAFNNI